ncbi:hypothetical protein DFS33DRAFT_1434188 [Desarmillaria ectypa]|nr:hypothetical protein DFS33DRAFT_1434188 [Desarmillaria ectypa]
MATKTIFSFQTRQAVLRDLLWDLQNLHQNGIIQGTLVKVTGAHAAATIRPFRGTSPPKDIDVIVSDARCIEDILVKYYPAKYYLDNDLTERILYRKLGTPGIHASSQLPIDLISVSSMPREHPVISNMISVDKISNALYYQQAFATLLDLIVLKIGSIVNPDFYTMAEVYIDFEGLKSALINQEKPLGAIWDAFRWGQYTRIGTSFELVQEYQRAKNDPDKYPQGLHLCEEALRINDAFKGFFPPPEDIAAIPTIRPPPFRSMSSIMAHPVSSPIVQPGRLDSSHRVVDVDFQLNFLPKVNVVNIVLELMIELCYIWRAIPQMFSEPPGDDEDDSLVVTAPATLDTASRTTWANGPNQSNHAVGSGVHVNMHCGIVALVSKTIDAERYRYLVLENFHYGIVDYVHNPMLDPGIIGILGAAPSTLAPPRGLDYDDNKTIIEAMYSGHRRMIEEPSFTISLGKGYVDGWLWCGPGPHPSLKNTAKTAFFQSALSRSGRPIGQWTAPLFKLEFVDSKSFGFRASHTCLSSRLEFFLGSALNSFLPEETDEIFSQYVKVNTDMTDSDARRGLSLKQDYPLVRLHFKDWTPMRPGALPTHWYIEASIFSFFGYNKQVDDEAYDGMPLTFNEYSHASLMDNDSESFGILGAPFFSMVTVEFRALQGKSAVRFRARDVATNDPNRYPNNKSFVIMKDLTDKR